MIISTKYNQEMFVVEICALNLLRWCLIHFSQMTCVCLSDCGTNGSYLMECGRCCRAVNLGDKTGVSSVLDRERSIITQISGNIW